MKRVLLQLFYILVALDLLASVLTGGLPHQTLSGRIGRAATSGNKWAVLFKKVVDTLFFFDKNHCINQIRHDALRGLQLSKDLSK